MKRRHYAMAMLGASLIPMPNGDPAIVQIGTSVSHAAVRAIDPASLIAETAKKLDGEPFKPGVQAQCAVFVRHVLSKAGIEVGVTTKPIDGWSTGAAMANSFFGEDIGTIIRDKNQLRPGDLVAWGGTYGGYSKDTITHVGIYVGDGMIVDRGTMEGSVTLRSIDTFKHFVAGVRPHSVN